jgi:hypothetical protein
MGGNRTFAESALCECVKCESLHSHCRGTQFLSAPPEGGLEPTLHDAAMWMTVRNGATALIRQLFGNIAQGVILTERTSSDSLRT